jgi:CBS domain-containing protein
MVKEAMSVDVKTCLETDTVDKLMDTMGREQVRRVPIVDERGSLVGVVAQADIVKKADDGKAERTVEKISKESGKHSQ